jgi:hypothetical protein
MSEKEKVKKPLYKKWWFWAIAILIVGSWIVGDDDKKESTSNDKENVEAVDGKVDTEKEEKAQKEQEKKEKEEQAKKEEKERKASRSIDEAISEDNDDVDKAMFKDGTLTLIGEGKTTFSENTLFMSVYDMFEAMHEGFQDKDVKEVYIELTTTMVDQKGNESVEPVIKYNYSRESFEELNYENFAKMSYSEEWRILTEANYYYIHPGIYKNLKDKYKDKVSVEGFND